MNTEIIQAVYRAFRSKDLPTILALQTEDTVWSVAGPPGKIPWAGPYNGKEGVTQFLKVLGGLLVPEVFEIQEYFEKDNKVIALGFQKGYVAQTKTLYEFDFVHVWEIREDKVTKFRVYYDTDYVACVLVN